MEGHLRTFGLVLAMSAFAVTGCSDSDGDGDGGGGGDNNATVTRDCEFPLTIGAPTSVVYLCAAEDMNACSVNNDGNTTVGDACGGNASAFFSIGLEFHTISAVTANGWTIEDASSGERSANVAVSNIGHGEAVTVTLAKDGTNYEIAFSANTEQLTITSLSQQ